MEYGNNESSYIYHCPVRDMDLSFDPGTCVEVGGNEVPDVGVQAQQRAPVSGDLGTSDFLAVLAEATLPQ